MPIVLALLFFLGTWFYFSFTLFQIAVALREPQAWVAWLPFFKVFTLWKIGERPPGEIRFAFVASAVVVASAALTVSGEVVIVLLWN